MYQGLFPPADEDYEADRTLTVDSSQEHKGHRDFDAATFLSIGRKRISKRLRWPLLIWVRISFLYPAPINTMLVSVRYSVRTFTDKDEDPS